MDQYTEYALSLVAYNVYKESVINENRLSKIIGIKGPITIQQAEDYTIDKYMLLFVSEGLKSITFEGKVYTPELYPDIDAKMPLIIFPISYAKKTNSLMMEFDGGILDPIKVEIQYIDTDKSIYDGKKQAELNAKIEPRILCGIDLINLYWNDATPDVVATAINVYGVFGYKTVNFKNEPIKRLAMSFKEVESHFKSITGLAFGEYYLEIIQYNKDNRLIATTAVQIQIRSR